MALRLEEALDPDTLAGAAVPGWARSLGAEGARAPASPSISGRGSRRRRPTGCCAPPGHGRRGAGARPGRSPRWWAGDRDRGPAVRGADLVRAGVPPGPAIGRSPGRGPRRAARRPRGGAGGAARPGPAGRPRGPVTGPELIEVATDAPARAVFSTRRGGGVARAGRDAEPRLGQGRRGRRGARRTGSGCATPSAWTPAVSLGRQVHGAEGADARRPVAAGPVRGRPARMAEGDALATRRPGLRLMVLAADCLPVLLWRRDEPGVAAAHAGWRGSSAGSSARRCDPGPPRPHRRRDRPRDRPLLLPGLRGGPRPLRGRLRGGRRPPAGRRPRRGGPRGARGGGRRGAGDRDRAGLHELPTPAASTRSGAMARPAGGRGGWCGRPGDDRPRGASRRSRRGRERLDEACARAGRPPGSAELVLAGKYVPWTRRRRWWRRGSRWWARTACRTCGCAGRRPAGAWPSTSSATCSARRRVR